MVTGFIEHLENAAANNYDSLTELYSLKITYYSTHKVFSVCYIFTNRWWQWIPTMFSASMLTFSLNSGWFATTSYSSDCRLKTQDLSRLYLSIDRKENVVTRCSSSVVAVGTFVCEAVTK
jgi:hypothetical protein